MKLENLIKILQQRFPGLIVINTWGETSLFYNPLNILKKGTYCFTFKESDGENDTSSHLNRDEVAYRMNFKLTKTTFLEYFDEPALPSRPVKGGVISLRSGRDYDPCVLDKIIPHPIYSWMSWVSVINPSNETIESLINNGLLNGSYQNAVTRHDNNRNVIRYRARMAQKNHRFSEVASPKILAPIKRTLTNR